MGSSKKHKEKDRDRDKRDKDRRERDKSSRYKDRDGEREERRDRDRKRKIIDDDLLDYAMEESSRDEGGSDRSSHNSRSDGGSSLSIEETNKIRAKLGLKPLEVDGSSSRKQSKEETSTATEGDGSTISIEATNKIREKLGLKPLKVESADNTDKSKGQSDDRDVHVPAINIAEQETTRKFKERIEEMREKRKIQKKLSKVKGLSLAEGGDDASSWVSKSRKIEDDKRLAQKRAQLLEEMDEEFGISDLVQEELGPVGKKHYSAADLRGIKVQHSQKMIEEGQSVILTLKDSSVLDEEGDILTNMNLEDLEKAKKNIDLRKKKPDYNPYDDGFNEEGEFTGKKSILSKYDDEEDDGSFTLDSRGSANQKQERKLQQIREQLRKQAQTLEMPAPKLATEFFTQDEMVQFKKPKKKRKVRKRTSLKVDELEAIVSESSGRSSADHGSRGLKSILKGKSDEPGGDDLMNQDDEMDIDFISPEDDTEILGPDRGEGTSLLDEDEAELELQVALERSRRMKMKQGFVGGADRVAAVVSTIVKKEKDEKVAEDSIVLDSTSEFCRALGDIPTYGGAGNRAEMTEEEEEETHMEIEEEPDEELQGGWERVKNEKLAKSADESQQEKEDVTSLLSDEPVISSGVGAALTLAFKKGLLEGVNKKVDEKFVANLPATKAVIDEEKMRDEERDRLRRERDSRMRDRDSHRDRDRDDFNKGFNFDVKLEYVDDHGRDLSPKEAFRYLSHKFHGKTSGKMKTEKRNKKQQEEMKLKKMSTTDTPLNTASLFIKKQQVAQSPYLILSGGGKALSTTSLTKGK